MASTASFRSSSLVFLLGTLAVAGCARSGGAEKGKEPPRVTVAHPVVRSLVDEDDYNGWLKASETVEVRARVRGHIQEIGFKDGDFVQKDQVLFQLDPEPFKAARDGAVQERESLKAQQVAADKNAVRLKELHDARAVSTSEFEQAVADAGSYKGRIAAKDQDIRRCQLDLDYASIRAPIAGRIGQALLTKGNLVNAGGSDPLLTTIVAVDPIYVDFNVDERAIQRYQDAAMGRPDNDAQKSLRAQKVAFAFGLDTEKGYPHQGQIVFADNKYSEGTGTILLRGVASNPDGRLVPGSRVRVRVPVSEKYEAATVPDSAVLSELDRKYVLVLGKGNTVLRRDITPGRLLDDGMRVILPAAGERKAAAKTDWTREWEKEWVITLGLQRARINYPVQPLDSMGQAIQSTAAAQ